MVTVTITASNPVDPYLRDWNIYTSSQTPPIQTINLTSGNTWTTQLEPGSYLFSIGQSGGPTYGTYSGIINDVAFSGVDANHAVPFTVSGAPPPGSNGGTPSIPTTTWIAIGVISLVTIIGAALYLKRKR